MSYQSVYTAGWDNALSLAWQTILGYPLPLAPPPEPLPQDVLPEPIPREEPLPLAPLIEGGNRVIYGQAILPFGLEPVDYATLLAMSGERAQPYGPSSGIPTIVDPYGSVIEPALPALPPLPTFLPLPPITPTTPLPYMPPLEPVAPWGEPAPFLPPLPIGLPPSTFVEEPDMSIIAAASKFFSSNVGQQLTGTLLSRIGQGSQITNVPRLMAMGGGVPALPGGFTTGGGFGGGATMRTGARRRKLTPDERRARGLKPYITRNPTNVHALRRALRRVEGFIKIEKRVDRILRKVAPKARQAQRVGFVKSRRR